MTALNGNEILYVVGVCGNGQLAATYEETTTADIAALGGGGGIANIVEITSGATVNGALSTYYIFNSATDTAKQILAPAATGSGHVISAIDRYGDAGGNGVQGPNPINFVPNGSDVVIGNQTQIYTSYGQGTWRDLKVGVWGEE